MREAAHRGKNRWRPILIGRLDDWMQVIAKRDNIVVNPGYLHWAGVAVIKKAYDVDGMTVDEFDGYGATVRTLRAFIGSYHDFVALIRDVMIPNPDVK